MSDLFRPSPTKWYLSNKYLAVPTSRGITITEDKPEPVVIPEQHDLIMSGMVYNNGLWIPEYMEPKFGWMFTPAPTMRSGMVGVDIEAAIAPEPVEEDYEVNLTEPLVGWRSWAVLQLKDIEGKYNGATVLSSINSRTYWRALKPLEAKCHADRCCKKLPNDYCTCGVYALDDEQPSSSEWYITGQVYGWGRYVRGDKGWRAQYAYPKSLHLSSNQADLIESLKCYRVPIVIDQPLTMYDPKEDGYHGYWEADSQGRIGAGEESSPPED